MHLECPQPGPYEWVRRRDQAGRLLVGRAEDGHPGPWPDAGSGQQRPGREQHARLLQLKQPGEVPLDVGVNRGFVSAGGRPGQDEPVVTRQQPSAINGGRRRLAVHPLNCIHFLCYVKGLLCYIQRPEACKLYAGFA